MALSNEVSPLDITSTNIKHVNRMFQEMEVRMAHLQRQVDSLRIRVRREHTRRKRLELRLVSRFGELARRVAESGSSGEDEDEGVGPLGQPLDMFEDMLRERDAGGSERESERMPRRRGGMLDSLMGGQEELPGEAPGQLMLDTQHPHEDLAALINDALNGCNGSKRRSLSNDFAGRRRQPSVGSQTRLPIFPIKPAAPSAALDSSRRYDENDIKLKYGVSFSEKYSKVSEIWSDYVKASDKGISIRSLEASFSNKWRANMKKSVKKKYNRRLIVVRAIETGIKRGRTPEECIEILDAFLRQNNKTVSHFYKKSNLPKELV
ncbi:AaceriAAR023Cp [[Ashbya] aceris (nom. inval.)]|nr:AaceriAAR023Cp [[Ashbya] aceris (nom. inval.)]